MAYDRVKPTYICKALFGKQKNNLQKRHFGDIIFDQNKISEHTIHNFMNNVDEHLEIKMSMEENKIINYLDLSINTNANSEDLSIYRKPTYMDITIHFSSNHPYGHKLAAFSYYINRMITMPISEQAVKRNGIRYSSWPKTMVSLTPNTWYEETTNR